MLTPRTLIEIQEWRYAVKKFDPTKKIPDDVWRSLEKSLVLSPSSYGLQAWKFLIVQDRNLRKQLTPLSWNQSQVEDCSHLVVFCRRADIEESDVNRFIERTLQVRGGNPVMIEGYRQTIINDVVKGPRHAWAKEWLARQVYIALGNFMTSAAALGVDTCPMEGIDPSGYDRVLGLTDTGYETLVACPAGYRSSEDNYQHLKKVRFEDSEVVKYL